MVIDLKKFFLSDGLSESVEYDMDLSGVELNGVKPFCAPVRVNAQIKSFGGSAILEARLIYRVQMNCDRCYETATHEYTPGFFHILVRELNAADEGDEYILVSQDRLDLDQLLLEDILLDMPSKFLCSSDCKGICPTCGKNLNEGECQCEKQAVDPRLEILKNLL